MAVFFCEYIYIKQMVKITYKIAIENRDNKTVYVLQADLGSDTEADMHYKTITKEMSFDDFNQQVKYTEEEVDLKTKVENIVKKALFTTAAAILNNDIVGEVAIIESNLDLSKGVASLSDKLKGSEATLNIDCGYIG